MEPCKPSFSVKSVSQGLFQFEKARPVSVCSIYDIHVLWYYILLGLWTCIYMYNLLLHDYRADMLDTMREWRKI